MSVINTMLKDLDKRQQPHSLENMNVAPVQYRSTSSSKTPWVLLALVCVLFISGMAYNWELLTQNSVSVEPQIESTESKTLAPAQPMVEQSSQLASVNNEDDEELGAPHLSAQPTASSVAKVADKIENETKVQVVKPVLAITQNSAPPVSEAQKIAKTAENETIEKLTAPVVVRASTPVSQPKTRVGSMAITEVKLSNSQLAEKRFQLATQSEENGYLQDAIEYYLEALTLTPELHKARQRLAALYYGLGRLASASEILKQGVELFPQRFDFLMLLARVQQAGGEFQQALTSLDRIPDDASMSKQKWTQESSIAQKVKNYPLAEKSYRKLLQTEATQSRWWMGLAYALDAQTKYTTAIEAYQQALFFRSVPEQGLSAQAVDYIENRLAQLGDSQ